MRFHRKSTRRALRHLRSDYDIQHVTAARHRLDQAAILITKLLAQLSDALHERVIAHAHIGPHGLEKLLLGREPPDVLYEVAQHLERLEAQVDLLIAAPQTSARKIEHKAVKPQDRADGIVQSALQRGLSSVDR